MRLLALCCGGDWPTGICGSRARQQRVCARDRPTFGDLAVTGDEKNEIPIFIGPGAIVLAAAKLRKCLRHVFIFWFAASGGIPKLKRSSCHSTSQISCPTVISNNQLFNATLKLLTSEESHS